MYSASEIAQYVIQHETNCGRPVSNLRLQKLLYFIQAQALMTLNRPCFLDEIEAWDFGPVVPSVYREYKIFGGSSIPCMFNLDENNINDPCMKKEIDKTLDQCAQYSTSGLVEITHGQAPWKNAYRHFDNRITRQSIQQYFGM